MQKVAAYLLERRDGMEVAEDRMGEYDHIRSLIRSWLQSKGAATDAASGSYSAVDRSHARFSIEEASDPPREWWIVRLEELTDIGRRFVASISVTMMRNSVAVYATLEAGTGATQIAPVHVDPKTPRIIRTLLSSGGHWYHGASQLKTVQRVEGFERGEDLAAEIADPKRTIPFIVLTEDNGELALPNLDRDLARDVAGLANVAVLDQDGTWALTDYLGAGLRCFGGAVRVYWPHLDSGTDPFRHPRWTAGRLRGSGDPRHTSEIFRRQTRSMIMRASALSVVRPSEIDEIRDSATNRVLVELKSRANSLADFEELADRYAEENDKLKRENSTLKDAISELEADLMKRDSEIRMLRLRADHTQRKLDHQVAVAMAEIAPEMDQEIGAEIGPPTAGEIRFYKKKYSAPNHDILIRVSDCGCGNWKAGNKADKAKKGIEKLEGSREWKSIHHCESCTGGGMWKVVW
jgi:hypothetical protein